MVVVVLIMLAEMIMNDTSSDNKKKIAAVRESNDVKESLWDNNKTMIILIIRL